MFQLFRSVAQWRQSNLDRKEASTVAVPAFCRPIVDFGAPESSQDHPQSSMLTPTSDALVGDDVGTREPADLTENAHRDATGACSLPRRRLLTSLANDSSEKIRAAAAADPTISRSLLRKLALDGSVDVRVAVASNSATPATTLRRLARDAVSIVRMGVASNPNASDRALGRLLEDPVVEVRQALARRCPPLLLARLADDTDPRVRSIVAELRSLSTELRKKLAGDPHPAVRCNLIHYNHANDPAEHAILAELSRDPDPTVRAKAADAWGWDSSVHAVFSLGHLVTDPDPSVRAALASSIDERISRWAHNCPGPLPQSVVDFADDHGGAMSTLYDLVDIADCDRGRPSLAAHLEGCGSLLVGYDGAIVWLAVQRELARDPDPQVREAVAGSDTASVALLRELGRDPDVRVRTALARRWRAPGRLLFKLACAKDVAIRMALAENPRIRGNLELQRLITNDPSPEVRARVVKYASELRPDIVAGLARDPDACVRLQVAEYLGRRHRRIDDTGWVGELLTLLVDDPDRRVREAAIQHGGFRPFIVPNSYPHPLAWSSPTPGVPHQHGV